MRKAGNLADAVAAAGPNRDVPFSVSTDGYYFFASVVLGPPESSYNNLYLKVYPSSVSIFTHRSQHRLLSHCHTALL
jgi:hypothetical protein